MARLGAASREELSTAVRNLVRSFRANGRGNVAMIFGLALPVLGGGLAGAMDLNTWYSAKVRLQNAVDGAALAAARELQLATATPGQVTRVAEAHVRATLAGRGPSPLEVTATPQMVLRTVEVSVRAEVSPIFSRMIMAGVQFIAAKATARLSNKAPVCVIGLDRTQDGTLFFQKRAQLTAERCAVYSNSSHSRGLRGENDAVVTAALFCSAGGASISKANFTPKPVTDCPPIEDPLAARPAPIVGGCLKTNHVVSRTTETLLPGTYCGGLKVTHKAVVTLMPGIYVFKDGPLVVDKKSSFQGENVGLYFAGDKAGLLFDKDSIVSLTAPKDGAMAGLLMFEERQVVTPVPAPTPDPDLVTGLVATLPPPLPPATPPMREYRIISDDARTLIGTIYLPVGRLMIDSKRAVADRSAYTVIVARRLDLFEGPNLYLNSNYAGSDIPVPQGVGPIGGSVSLSQ